MKSWIVRFASLYVFNVIVLLVIGWITPAHVGWAVIWASVVLTLVELFVKPLIQGFFVRATAKSAADRTRAGEAVAQGLIVLAVAAIIWVITLVLTGVSAGGSWFWAYVLPPIIIAIGWFVYSKIDDRIEARAAVYYDKAQAGIRGSSPAAPATPTAAVAAELDDGLTPEQRKMLDDLGKS